jgi:hypothetical protein
VNVSFDQPRTLYSVGSSPLIVRLAASQDKVYLVCNENERMKASEGPQGRQAKDPIQADIDARSTIRCCISTDRGDNFSEMLNLYQSNVAQLMPPEIKVSRGRAFLAWGDSDEKATCPTVLLSKSNENDSGFENPIKLNHAAEEASTSQDLAVSYTSDPDGPRRELFRRWYLIPRVKLAVAGDNVYVFWSETKAQLHSDVEYRLYFRASNDEGKTFGDQIHVGTTILKSTQFMRLFHINLTAAGNEVYMMWVQFTPVPGYMFSGKIDPLEAHMAVSRNAGKTIEKTIDLSHDTNVVLVSGTDSPSLNPNRRSRVFERLPLDIVATGDGHVNMVLIGHETYGPDDIMKAMMESKPADKGIRMEAGSGEIGYGHFLDINLPVYFAKSVSFASSFSTPLLLAEYSAGIDDTYLVCNSNNAHVIWRTVTENDAIYCRSSTDGGKSFGARVQVPGIRIFLPQPSPIHNGAIVSSHDGKLLVAMRNDLKSLSTFPLEVMSEILFSASANAGSTFSDPQKLSSDSAQAAIFPSIDADGVHVFVAWSEARKGGPTLIKFTKGLIQ